MRKLVITLILLGVLIIPVNAQEFTAPAAPEGAQQYMPRESGSFLSDFWYVIKSAIADIQPSFAEASRLCLSVLAVVLLTSIVYAASSAAKTVTVLTGTIAVGVLLISPTNTLIGLGIQTVSEVNEYGKMLIPVITAALAAQGGVTSSTALYTVTTLFCTILSALIKTLLTPLIYIYLCLSVASCSLGEELLVKFKNTVKTFASWILRTILYVFTGFLAITGVISGSTDASALKAAKLTISGFVPVVGGILSDASEAVLVGAGLMKNAAGAYGVLAILAICIGPFLRIGIQYLLVKITGGLCEIFDTKQISSLVQDFSGAMGIVLGMIGTECVMLLISTVCFMRGVST